MQYVVVGYMLFVLTYALEMPTNVDTQFSFFQTLNLPQSHAHSFLALFLLDTALKFKAPPPHPLSMILICVHLLGIHEPFLSDVG